MSRTYSPCMAQAVEARLVRGIDTAAVDAARECGPILLCSVEVGPHALLRETRSTRWA